MKRIIVVSKYMVPYDNGFYAANALIEMGHEVRTFGNMITEKPFESLMELIHRFNPELVLIIKGIGVQEEWIDALKQHNILTVIWYPDVDDKIPEWVVPLARKVDFFFTMAEGWIGEWKKQGVEHISWLSQGFEPSFFSHRGITPYERETYQSDITFIGNIDSTKLYLSRRYRLSRIIKDGFQLKWWGQRLGRKPVNIPVIFSKLGRSYGGRSVYFQDFAKIVQCSKLFLAFDAVPQVRKSMSARMYTAIGCGAFYLCQYVDGMEEVFVPDKEIVTFRDDDEMIDKIRYYLPREDKRREIAGNGQRRILAEYTYQHRLNEMMDILRKNGLN